MAEAEMAAGAVAVETNCTHPKLMFGSGGYYIFCNVCWAAWVAVKHGNDSELDYMRRGEGFRETKNDSD